MQTKRTFVSNWLGAVLLALGFTLMAAAKGAETATSDKPALELTATETVIGPLNQIQVGAADSPVSFATGLHTVSVKTSGNLVGSVVVDGKNFDVSPGTISGSVVISPDGKRLAYIVRKEDNKRAVVVDGVEGKLYDSVEPSKPVFSPDSKQLAYIASVGAKASGQTSPEQFMVINGVEGKHYAYIWPGIQFSSDGKHMVYAASTQNANSGTGRLLSLVKDGVEGKAYPDNGYITPQRDITFSPDGQRLAFSVAEGKQARPVIDGVEGKLYDSVNFFTFSPDGRRVAFLAKRGYDAFCVIDGIEGPAFDPPTTNSILPPVIFFSADGKRTAYRAKHGTKSTVVIDGVEGKPYDDILLGPQYFNAIPGMVFSPDGKHTAYLAKLGPSDSNWCAVVDGVAGKAYAAVYSPMYSPDSQHLAFFASSERNKFFVVRDGVEGKAYARLAAGPLFSPDSKHLAYAPQANDSGTGVIVVDEVECFTPAPIISDPRYGQFIHDIFYFESPARLTFLAMTADRQCSRVTVDIAPGGK